jgi:hypothetical protein
MHRKKGKNMKKIVMILMAVLVVAGVVGCNKSERTSSASTAQSEVSYPVHVPKPEDYIVQVIKVHGKATTEDEGCRDATGNYKLARSTGILRSYVGAGKCSCKKEGELFVCTRNAFIAATTTAPDGIPRTDDGKPIKGITEDL